MLWPLIGYLVLLIILFNIATFRNCKAGEHEWVIDKEVYCSDPGTWMRFYKCKYCGGQP